MNTKPDIMDLVTRLNSIEMPITRCNEIPVSSDEITDFSGYVTSESDDYDMEALKLTYDESRIQASDYSYSDDCDERFMEMLR